MFPGGYASLFVSGCALFLGMSGGLWVGGCLTRAETTGDLSPKLRCLILGGLWDLATVWCSGGFQRYPLLVMLSLVFCQPLTQSWIAEILKGMQ